MSYSNDGGWKRARITAPPQERNIEDDLEDLVNRVAEENTTSSLKTRLSTLAGILEADLNNRQDVIFNIIIRCVKGRPNNIGVCSGIIGIININMYNQCGEFVDCVMKEFKDCLINHQFNSAQSMLKFVSDLVNPRVVMPSSLLHLYTTILSAATTHQHNKLYSDWMLGSLLMSLSYSGKELSQKRPEELDVLLSSIDRYVRSRDRDCMEMLSVWSNEGGCYDDDLRMWWEGVGELRGQGWEENVVPRPYLEFEEVWRKDALPHTIPPLSIPPPPSLPHQPPDSCPYLPTRLFPLPVAQFHIFEASDVPSNLPPMPAPNSIERFFVTETINTVIDIHHSERKICAAALLSLDFRCKVPLNYLVTESIFRRMLHPPSDDLSSAAAYDVTAAASLLIELCKLQHESVPQVLAQATVILYDKLNLMNAHCVDRLSRWFAFHLNNFMFKWGWEDWMDALSHPPLHPKSRFVTNTLSFCLRLSYYELVTKIVPDEMASLLPPLPSPSFKYQPPHDTPGGELSGELMKMFTNRSSVSQVSKMIETAELPSLEKVDVFVHTLLHASSRVISFSLNALTRYNDVLKAITQMDKQEDNKQKDVWQSRREVVESQVQVLVSLHEFWKNKPLVVELLTDKLLKTGVVSWKAIVTWTFCLPMTPYLTSTYMDRILHAMLDHFHSRVCHDGGLLEEAKKKMRKRLARDYSTYDEEEEDDDDDDDERLRTEDDMDKEESRLNALVQELRKAQCCVVKNLVERLCDLLPTNQPHLFTILLHRLRSFLFKHPEYSSRNITYLSTSVFTADVEPPIITTFHHFVTIFS